MLSADADNHRIEAIARAFGFLPADQRALIRKELHSPKIAAMSQKNLAVAGLVLDEPSQLMEVIKSSTESVVKKLEAIAALPGGAVSDPDLIQLLVKNLNARSRRQATVVAAALANLDAACVSPGVAEQLVETMRSRRGGSDFSNAVCRLTIQNPDVFAAPLSDAYRDTDSPGNDSACEALPCLGNHLVHSDLLSLIAERATSAEARISTTAHRILARSLNHADGACRDQILVTAAKARSSNQRLLITSVLRSTSIDEAFVQWLICQLDKDDPDVVSYICKLLTDREPGISQDRDRRPVVARFDLSRLERFQFRSSHQRDTPISILAKAAVDGLRLFKTDESSGFGMTIQAASR